MPPRRARSWLLALLLLVVGSTSALGADYYVSPSGSDTNPGSSRAPFRSIGRGTQAVRAGDVLHLAPGLYPEGPLTLPSGSTLRGTGGAKPVIQPPSPVDHILLFPSGSQGTTVDNVVIDGARRAQFPVATQDASVRNLTLQNSEVKHGKASCLLVEGTGWQILNNYIHDCGTDTTYDHGIYFQGNHSRIAGNTIERSSCYNIQNFGKGNTSNNVYEHNTFKDSGCGVTLSTGQGHTFRNNTMVNEGVRQEGGMLLGTPNTTMDGNRLTNTRLTTINDNAGGSTVTNTTACNGSVELTGVSERGTSTACDSPAAAGASRPTPSPLVEAAAGRPTSGGTTPPPPLRFRMLAPGRRS